MRRQEMTGAELKHARHALGLTIGDFADLMNLVDLRPIRRWEIGDREIPGPIITLLTALMESEAVRAHFGLKLNEPGRRPIDD